jgi:pyrroline-5-carboxylate reductase
VGIIGSGNLCRALVQGLAAGGHPNSAINISTRRTERGRVAARDLGVSGHPRNRAVVEASDLVLLTVKPNQVLQVCEEIRPTLGDKVLITCAAGVTTDTCLGALEDGARVGRALPNVAAAVRRGAAAIWLPDSVSGKERESCIALFEESGIVVELPNEVLFDVATALVGSGPAFTCVFAEALADAAVSCGLPRDLAQRLSAATVEGTGRLLAETGDHPALWKARITSPGGTTAAGLAILEEMGGRAAAMAAVVAATERAGELGDLARLAAKMQDQGGEES